MSPPDGDRWGRAPTTERPSSRPQAQESRPRGQEARPRVLGGIDLGTGAAVVLLQGFALRPRTYLDVARLLAQRCHVLVPPLFAQPGTTWSPERVLDDLEATLDAHGMEQVTLIGHSFGGALELNFATRHPDRVNDLVFVDTLAMSREWTLAVEALHPLHLLWMATPRAAIDFTAAALSHPVCLARAGWWGFRSDRRAQVDAIAATDIPTHVLWADRDSLLSRADGQAFAEDLGADFTVVHGPNRHPVDHDWIYRHPTLLIEQLDRLGLAALGPPISGEEPDPGPPAAPGGASFSGLPGSARAE